MKNIFFVLLVLSLAFAVGSGSSSGSSTSIKTLTLKQLSYSCDNNTLVILASDNSGPLVGVNAQFYQGDSFLTSAITNENGEVSFVINNEGRYLIVARADGFANREMAVNIAACRATEPEFRCTEGDMRSRIRCRMMLSDDEVRNVSFMPEECRLLANKTACIETYRTFQTCRLDLEGDDARAKCIRPKLGIGQEVREEVVACQALNGTARQECFQTLRDRVFLLVKFRMYNLVYKAQKLQEEGVNETLVLDFISYLEDAKIRFNNAPDIASKKAILIEVKQKWLEFVEQARPQVNE